MMKSAIDWLMGKSESLSLNNDFNLVPSNNNGADPDNQSNKSENPNENTIFNGHFRAGNYHNTNSFTRINNSEEMKSPWGRTLTPKSPKYMAHMSPKGPHSPRLLSPGLPKRLSPSTSWDEMSFTSEVMSPGFASRIAKEARGSRKPYDGSRKYPIGQEKYIRPGIIPNVQLKGRSKPVVMSRRAPTSPLLPLASQTSPFSSSSLASGFLASASTRMPDISSVVSVLDSTPTASASDSIKDPTSVQAVVAALEQAQSLKSGVKRSRYGDNDDSSKKQKCTLNTAIETINEFPTPVIAQAFSNGRSGGEKRVLDLSPITGGESSLGPSSGLISSQPQLSPENKRRCIPDPRIASFSSSKNHGFGTSSNSQSTGGRETPLSFIETNQDSDSESNKSLESHTSRQSDRSYRGQATQNHDSGGRTPTGNQDQYDRSESQTPQSLKGSYGVSNGSSHSSRTGTPSRLSHAFSLEAYKADRAKSQQRLNKMLGILFNTPDEDAVIPNQTTPSPSNFVSSISSSDIPSPAVSVSSSATSFENLTTINTLPLSTFAPSSGLLKEVTGKANSDNSLAPTSEQKSNDQEIPLKPVAENGGSEVSANFTMVLKSPKPTVTSASSNTVGESESCKTSSEKVESEATHISLPTTAFQLPSYQDSIASTSLVASSAQETNSGPLGSIKTSLSNETVISSVGSESTSTAISTSLFKDTNISLAGVNTIGNTSVQFPTFSISKPTSTTFVTSNNNPSVISEDSNKPPSFNFSSNLQSNGITSQAAEVPFSFGKSTTVPSTQSSVTTESTPNMFKSSSDNAASTADPTKVSNFFSTADSTSVTDPKLSQSSLVSPSLSIFAPTSLSSGGKNNASQLVPPASSSSGLFSFSVGSPPATFPSSQATKDKPSAISATTIPSLSSPFTFGSTLPQSTPGVALPAIDNNVPASGLFKFGPTKPSTLTTESDDKAKTSMISTDNGSKNTNVLTSSGITFGLAPPAANSAAQLPTAVTTSTSILGGNSNLFSFGSSSVKAPNTGFPSSAVSSNAPGGSIFTFGDSSSGAGNQSKGSSSFQFGATPSSSSSSFGSTPQKPTSITGSSGGGGFSFGRPEPSSTTTTVTTSSTTTAPSTHTFPHFGPSATSTTNVSTVSSTFTFSSTAASKPMPGFNFGSAVKTTSSDTSNIFNFGNTVATQPSPFGDNPTVTSAPARGLSAIPPSNVLGSTFTFGSGGGGAQPAPTFGSSTENKSAVKPFFGGDDAPKPSSAVSPFGYPSSNPSLSSFLSSTPQNQNPFNTGKTPNPASPPSFNVFGSPNAGSNTASAPSTAAAAPNQNPFQMGQSPPQSSAAFTFGQTQQQTSPQPGVFLFGSQTNTSSSTPAAPAFGAGSFNFGSSNVASPTTNIFSVGATTEPATAPRRVKVRLPHRRR